MLEQKIEGHRITIILDDEIVRKLRSRQAEMLMESRKAVTMTSVIKEALNEYLKNEKD
jgi:predicted transcriptional regulator